MNACPCCGEIPMDEKLAFVMRQISASLEKARSGDGLVTVDDLRETLLTIADHFDPAIGNRDAASTQTA